MSGIQHEAWEEIEHQYLLLSQKTTLFAHNSSDHLVCVAANPASLKICKDSSSKVTKMLSSQKLWVLH